MNVEQLNLAGTVNQRARKLNSSGTYQIGMIMNGLLNALTCEGLLPEASLDIVQHFSMDGVVLVQDVL